MTRLRSLRCVARRFPALSGESGFSLIELLISMVLVLVIFSGVTTALSKLSNAQRTIWNRTEMHSGVRGATELLQQEAARPAG